MTHIKDIGWLLLLGLLLPLWMALALVALVAIVVRHLYLWVRGNTTATSRPRRSPPASAVPGEIAPETPRP